MTPHSEHPTDGAWHDDSAGDHGLLEHLVRVHRAITTRVSDEQLFAAVVDGGRRLLGGSARVEVSLVPADDQVATPGQAGPTPGPDPTMTAPLFRNGELTATLVITAPERDRAYSEDEHRSLGLFAEYVSLALDAAAAVGATERALGDAVHQATHDHLTGLPNRALVVDRLEHALAHGDRTNAPVTAFFVDIDRFKAVNDLLGRHNGDRVLIAVGDRIASCLGSGDTLGRLAGDVFVVLCEALTVAEAEAVAAEMLRAVAEPLPVPGHDTSVTASVGIARGDRDVGAEHLLGNADIALHRAKERGRARVEHFDQALRERMQGRLRTEQALRVAVPSGELTLHYQPTVWSPTGEVVSMEALLRWNHPTQGLVTPAGFIDVAEDTGLIVPIGAWVLARACRDAARWHTEVPALRGTSLSVNLSARQLADADLFDAVTNALAHTGLPPEQLWLELTESTLMDDADATIDTLDALRGAGVRFAVDDFGTGYSSLSYLRRFPVDALKIDQSFVLGLADNREDEAIVRAVARMAKELGLTTVAEGIETAEQSWAVAELGCLLCQGFLYARPAPVEDAIARSVAMNRAHAGPSNAVDGR